MFTKVSQTDHAGLSLLLCSGETHSVSGTSSSYTLAADVGLLTRNIKIIGQEYPEMMQESFGARLLVGTYSWAGIDYKGNKSFFIKCIKCDFCTYKKLCLLCLLD